MAVPEVVLAVLFVEAIKAVTTYLLPKCNDLRSPTSVCGCGHLRLHPLHRAVPTPSAFATFSIPSPVTQRALMALSTFPVTLGLPSVTPRARALSRPALTRLRIMSRSNSAKAPVT